MYQLRRGANKNEPEKVSMDSAQYFAFRKFPGVLPGRAIDALEATVTFIYT